MPKPLITFFKFFGIIIIISSIIHFMVKTQKEAIKEIEVNDTKYSSKLPDDYAQIAKTYQNISFEETVISKTREAISEFTYQKKFALMLYKLPVNNDKPLNKIVKLEYVNSNIPNGIPYFIFSAIQDPFIINYKVEKPEKTDSVFLNLLGNNTTIIKKGDSTVTYSCHLNNFSIRYGLNKHWDFYGELKPDSVVSDPFRIEFRKYQNSIYLILIYQKRSNSIPHNPSD